MAVLKNYRVWIWPIVLIISYLGFWFPRLGLPLFPMFAAILIIGFYRGRYWCGNICPRGALWDKVIETKKASSKPFLKLFKSNAFRLFIFIGLMTLFTRNTVQAFQFLGEKQFLDKLGMVGVIMCALTTTVGAILAVTVHPRTWCSFCPMGSAQKFLFSVKENTIGHLLPSPTLVLKNPASCVGCGVCGRVCPMQLMPYKQVGDLDCIQCGACTKKCKRKLLEFQLRDHLPIKEKLTNNRIVAV